MPVSAITNQTDAEKEQQGRQPLGNAQRSEHQAVSPHSFNEETSERIPDNIAQDNFAAFEQMIPVPETH